jgi:hypothetical protein
VRIRKHNRGSILIVASLFTFLSLLAAFTLFKVLPVEYNAAKKSRIDIAAHYAADAGVKEAIAWIEAQPQVRILNEDALSEFNSTFGALRNVAPDWQHQVTIERIESGHFGITSQAYFREQKVREVKAQVARESFSRYALFIDHWSFDEANEPSLVYNLGQSLLTGPFHTNDFFALAHDGFGGTGDPFVSGPYAEMTHARSTDFLGEDISEFSPDGNAYVSGFNGLNPVYNTTASHVPFNADGALEDRYQRIVEGGRGALTQVESIDFPRIASDSDGTSLREKARGVGNTQFQDQGMLDMGVYVPVKDTGEVYGGVYVVGDSELELKLDPNGNQVQEFAQTHLAEFYVEEETVEVRSPRYNAEQTDTPPEFVDEVHQIQTTRRVIVGYEANTVTTSDGITQPVQTPIYGDEPVTVSQIVSVPYDPAVHGTGPFTIYVEDVDNPYVYNTIVTNPIPEDEYDPENPAHQIQYQEAGDRIYEVVEVSEDAGYQIPEGLTIEGAAGSTVPKDHTVLIDRNENLAVVTPGNLNGVTFADGSLESLKGVSKGAVTDGPTGHTYAGRTIAVAPEFNKNIQITGHLNQYYNGNDSRQGPNRTLKAGEFSPNASHVLGLIGHDIELNPSFQTSDTNPLNIYAILLAGSGKYDSSGEPIMDPHGHQKTTGGFGTNPALLALGAPFQLGRFELYGGIIEGNARPWFANPGGSEEGLAGRLNFDPAAASGLQNFPTTHNLKIVRYSEYVDFD